MKRLIVYFVLIVFVLPEANAQLWKLKRYEAQGYLGTSQFFGDVGGYSIGDNLVGIKDFSFKQTRFSAGVFAKYRLQKEIKAKGGISFTFLHATDTKGSNENRGFESSTTVIEPMVMGEYYFLMSKAQSSYLFMRGRSSNLSFFWDQIDVYGTAGLGGAIYSVKPNDVLAARIKKDKGFAVTFPVGVGSNLILTPSMSVGVEFIVHFALTDYLDGYTSQYSARNDLFYTFNLCYSYKFSWSVRRRPNGVRF
ncbi:MAG TPA: hypothetical protein PLP69_03920 [Bacteroidales bacterium]|nr:hypothetical protein [Bacteroidales bacterium]